MYGPDNIGDSFNDGMIDTLIGGLGDDEFVVHGNDRVIEGVGEGFDRVLARSEIYRLEAGSEVEVLTADWAGGGDVLDLDGNEFAQSIYGNSRNNTLTGGGGEDVLYGLGGDDLLYAEDAFTDTLFGGSGSDTYTINAANGGTGADVVVEVAGEGFDRIFVNGTGEFVLAAGSEIEWMEGDVRGFAGAPDLNLTGNEFGQVISGTRGRNVIDGQGGNDQLEGGGGNDVLIGGLGDDEFVVHGNERVIEGVGEGTDRVIASSDYSLEAGTEVEVLIAGGRGYLHGNEFAQSIYGNSLNNTLTGGGGEDVLYGLGGNDTLYAEDAAFSETLIGGPGNDGYILTTNDSTDVVVELAGEGSDGIFVSGAGEFVLGAGIEIEGVSAFSFSANRPPNYAIVNLTGNEFGQTIHGSFGRNVIDGKGGNDVLRGEGGLPESVDDYMFTTAFGPGANNIDTILDFRSGIDRIVLDNSVFAGLAEGPLSAGAFRIGSAAMDTDDRILFDQSRGPFYPAALLFDPDGIGGEPAIQFAALDVLGGMALPPAAADFIVI
jgi:Ca2+-binding RTX toxin-like protein